MLDVRELRAVARRQNAAFEAQLSRLFDAGFGLRDASNFASQAHFSEKNSFRIYVLFLVTGGDGGEDAEVDRRLVDLDAAGDVDEDILIEELRAHFFLQYSDQQSHAVVI